MENKSMDRVIGDAVRLLNKVVDDNIIEEVPTVKNGNVWYKSIGIGAMNLHGYLAKNYIKYSDTKHSIDFARTFFSTMRYWAIHHSMQMAKETGERFKDFEKSEYYSGEVFEPYIQESHEPQTDKVKALFEGMDIPTPEDWWQLKKDVHKHGIRNAYLMAIAPNASTAYIQNATPSVLPIQELIEPRVYGDLTSYYPMPYLKQAYFTYMNDTAYDMSMITMIDVVAEIQKHVDQGISMTLFVNSDTTTRDLNKYYIHAWKKGLKSIYYTRTKEQNAVDECVACVV